MQKQSCSVEEVFLDISQNSQENIHARVSFLINFTKKETLAQLFSCVFCEISKDTFSYRIPPMAASGGDKFLNVYYEVLDEVSK